MSEDSHGYCITCPKCGAVQTRSYETNSTMICNSCRHEFYAYLQKGLVIEIPADVLRNKDLENRMQAFAVVDANGIQVAKDSEKGFDEETIRQIRDRMKTLLSEKELAQTESANRSHAGKPKLENWQKYLENGEYLRRSEIADE